MTDPLTCPCRQWLRQPDEHHPSCPDGKAAAAGVVPDVVLVYELDGPCSCGETGMHVQTAECAATDEALDRSAADAIADEFVRARLRQLEDAALGAALRAIFADGEGHSLYLSQAPGGGAMATLEPGGAYGLGRDAVGALLGLARKIARAVAEEQP